MDGVQWMIVLILFHSRALSRVSCMSPVQLAVDHCRFLGERVQSFAESQSRILEIDISITRGKRGKVRILEAIEVSKFNKKFIASITPLVE